MPEQRPRRILRSIAITLVGVLLLPAAYVTSAVSLTFAYAAGCVPDPVIEVVVPAYEPLSSYVDSGYPGAEPIVWACEVANDFGERLAER